MYFKLIGALTSKPYSFIARPWEIESIESIDFFNSLGCSINIDVKNLEIIRILPKINDYSVFITDKIRFSYDSLKLQRLVVPLILKKNEYIPISWYTVLDYLLSLNTLTKVILQKTKLNTLFLKRLLTSSFFINEDINLKELNVSKLIFQKFINNQRLNLFNKNYINIDNLNNIINPNLFIQINNSNILILFGINLRFEFPILWQYIINKVKKNQLKLYIFGSNSKLNCNINYLGFTIYDLYKIFFFKNKKISINYEKLKKNHSILWFFGSNIIKRVDFNSLIFLIKSLKQFLIKFNISFEYMFLYNNLVELNAYYINYYTDFRNNLNLKKLNLFNKNYNIDFNKIYKFDLYSSLNLLYSCNQNNMIIDIKDFDLVIYQGHHGDFLTNIADLILPTTYIYEKNNNFINLLGEFKYSKFIFSPIIDIRDNLKIYYFFNEIFNPLKDNLINNNINYKKILLRNYFYNNFSNLIEIYFIHFFKKKIQTITLFEKCNLNLNENINIIFYQFHNFLFFDIYNNYILTDSISRSSILLSLGSKYKEKTKNYLN